jgi:hypothetical protein
MKKDNFDLSMLLVKEDCVDYNRENVIGIVYPDDLDFERNYDLIMILDGNLDFAHRLDSKNRVIEKLKSWNSHFYRIDIYVQPCKEKI